SINRITGSVTTKWTPSSNLAARLIMGLDQNSQSDLDFARVGEGPDFGFDAEGNRTLNKFVIGIYSIDGSMTLNKDFTTAFRSKTTFGGQFYSTRINGTFATGNGIAAGSNTIGGTAQPLANSQNTVNSNGGLYLEEVGAFSEKFFATLGGRLDQASGFARSQG